MNQTYNSDAQLTSLEYLNCRTICYDWTCCRMSSMSDDQGEQVLVSSSEVGDSSPKLGSLQGPYALIESHEAEWGRFALPGQVRIDSPHFPWDSAVTVNVFRAITSRRRSRRTRRFVGGHLR